MKSLPNSLPSPASDLVSYDRWPEKIGISSPTGWRWRKKGLIPTTNINGRVYIRRSDVAEFERRASRGVREGADDTESKGAGVVARRSKRKPLPRWQVWERLSDRP